MICIEQVKKYCRDDISLIENYYIAINDETQTYPCHHKLEIQNRVYTVDELKAKGLYYNRPASELIFLTSSEHTRIHNLANKATISKRVAETNKKRKGKKHSEESKKKMKEAWKRRKERLSSSIESNKAD